ncbi:putative bifunctional diguanylate cyclase/phosphodiesterase [Massilia endophytica]|uniref:putative bifunctional diguanylate cyclase/phosphodiesterase n=1 Tax=Massilia endophytica TaxID=2899220 RepID=UPI001E486525|nr:EAL domain-containing protein [Massilia endophytica]UGQ44907.1 EAL domain-containing protein [Massilia endophytica]
MNLLVGTFYVLDEAGYFVLWNEKVEQLTGFGPEQLRGMHMLELFPAEEKPRVARAFCAVFQQDEKIQLEAWIRLKGELVPYLFWGARMRAGETMYMFGMGMDLSAPHRQQSALDLRERALHAASNGIVITRHDGMNNPIEYVNPAFERITGYSAEEALGRDSGFMAIPGIDEEQRGILAAAIAAQRPASVTFRNHRKNGEVFWNHLTITPVSDRNRQVTHYIGIIEDITALKVRTAELEHQVTHDPLTNLANRILLRDRLEQAIHAAQRNQHLVATILMDLNKFKEINDTLGHAAGDHVLREVASRLQSAVRESDTVARLGGDEFVLVLANQPSFRFTLQMIERVRRAMAPEMDIDGRPLAVGASMGVALYPSDALGASELLHAADTAMYEGKHGGPDAVHFYSPAIASSSAARQRMEHALKEALERDDLYLLFQPDVCITSGRILGLEALLRWRHPERGELLPADFLPEAEENGLIVPLGRRVLEEVCDTLHHLAQLGFPDLPISLNASGREISQRDYLPHIARRVAHHGVKPSSLAVEVREEQLVNNMAQAKRLADGMSELGIKLSVDDFGAGLSNLSYLQELPVSQLKLARRSVSNLSQGNGSWALAKTMLDIGHNLNIRVVATGVETQSQHDFLAANGCSSIQGNYVSRPMSRPALDRWLTAQ